MYLIMYLTGQTGPQQLGSKFTNNNSTSTIPINKLHSYSFDTSGKPITFSAISDPTFKLWAQPFVEQYLAKDSRLVNGNVQVKHVEKRDYVQHYKQYYAHLQFKDKNEVLLVNKSMHYVNTLNLNAQMNQTSKYYDSGFMEYLLILQDNFST